MKGPFVIAAVTIGALACTDVDLVLSRRPVTVAGAYCTQGADVYDLPMRILLVLDTSASMEVNDPGGHRATAAAELVTAVSSHETDSFGLLTFDTAALPATERFTRDPVDLGAALSQLERMEGFTNYLDALATAEVMVNDDIALVARAIAEAEAAGESTQLLRPWYFVVFLSDGIPRMPGGVLQGTDEILWRVEQLIDVPPEAAGLTLHTAFLGAADDVQRPEAEALLQRMADTGGGTYTSFENGEEIDFTVFDFQIKRRFDIKQLLVYNRSAVLHELGVVADSDGDGIADIDEEEDGTSPVDSDSDGDGCSDGFEHLAGLDPGRSDCPCDPDGLRDHDRDGLADCEEEFLGYDPRKFDTDGDLFADGLELRVGTNGADGADALEDLDFDGVTTEVEIRQGTDPVRADDELHHRHAYRYVVERSGLLGEVQRCYTVRVENIGLASTAETELQEERVNEIVLELIESPEDAAEEQFTLWRAVLPVAYGLPHAPAVTFTAEDFVAISHQEGGIDE